MDRTPPCRLFVILARDEPVAAILRRGPSDWCHLIRWHTHRDAFEHGAWFKGRIYEDKCDLSPDGQLFVYACHKGSRIGSSYTDAWTAVSRFPWLHALALWPLGTTYGGGGRFAGNRKLVVRWGSMPQTHPDHPATGLDVSAGRAPTHDAGDTIDDAEWSGTDHRGRLIYCRAGRLFRRTGSSDTEVRDFNDLEPNPIPAPDWARRPLTGRRS